MSMLRLQMKYYLRKDSFTMNMNMHGGICLNVEHTNEVAKEVYKRTGFWIISGNYRYARMYYEIIMKYNAVIIDDLHLVETIIKNSINFLQEDHQYSEITQQTVARFCEPIYAERQSKEVYNFLAHYSLVYAKNVQIKYAHVQTPICQNDGESPSLIEVASKISVPSHIGHCVKCKRECHSKSLIGGSCEWCFRKSCIDNMIRGTSIEFCPSTSYKITSEPPSCKLHLNDLHVHVEQNYHHMIFRTTEQNVLVSVPLVPSVVNANNLYHTWLAKKGYVGLVNVKSKFLICNLCI